MTDDEIRETYPGVSYYKDRHGKTRWRFRRKGRRDVSLPGAPGEPAFEAAWRNAAAGRGGSGGRDNVTRLPSAAHPRSLRGAWVILQGTSDWLSLAPITRAALTRIIEQFLETPVAEAQPAWGTFPVADLKRRHLKAILGERSQTPHAGRRLLIAIRKLIEVAIDEEWIEADPSHRLKWRPALKGFAPWPLDEIDRFDRRWPPGTTPRLVKDLAFWLGLRRKNIAILRKDQRARRSVAMPDGTTRVVDGFEFLSVKTGKPLFLPIPAPMMQSLSAMPEHGAATVVATEAGNPFSEKSLGGRMSDWCHSAGVRKGLTLHGLRKALGDLAADGGATTRQSMGLLGHDDIEQAETYSRGADQVKMALAASDAVVRLMEARRA